MTQLVTRVGSRVALVCFLLASANIAHAQLLWSEDAENGYTNIIDGTGSSYSLIQSEAVGQGSYAFHLANPDFNDNWFVLNQDISIQPDTDLYFLSRLGYATTSQLAKVQLSTNGGSTWPTTVYSQSGDNTAGEGAFSLKSVDLASYAGQNVRFRFMYDFVGGSAYTQTSTNVGWLVDDIQIGNQFEKIPYSVGDPSAHEQLYLEYINRARSDAMVEANRLAAETDPDITSAYNYFGIDTQDIVDQFQWYVDYGFIDQFAQPLSFNANLLTAAQLHTQDMFDNEFQGHYSSSYPPSPFLPGYSLGQRADAVGYVWTNLGENVYSYAESVAQGHAGLDVDWGNTYDPYDPAYNPDFNGQGMQNPAGHRLNIHNDVFKEVGIGVINDTNGSVGPQLVTQDFGSPGDATFITGVVYEDLNGNNFYDIGEGRSGVRVDVDGSAYYATSSTSGAYSVPVDGDGVYDITFSGGGYDTWMTSATVTSGWNVKADYLATATSYDGDFDQDGDVDVADLMLWQSGGSPDPYSAADLDEWKTYFTGGTLETGSTPVPEPGAAGLLLAGMAAVLVRRCRMA